MSIDHTNDYLAGLVRELSKLPHETEWVEFKVNNADLEEIGQYLSALANAAAINGKAFAYVVWGVEDQTHRLVGTSFSPTVTKKGNEPLESWLLRQLTPKIHFHFHELTIDGLPVVLLEVGRAFRHPLRFNGEEYIRIGEAKKRLKEAPDRERDLWRIFDQTPFENLVVLERAAADEVLRLLDYPAYFDLLEQPLPADRDGILAALASDSLILPCEAGGWDITNLGAILFAKRLENFRALRRKALRIIQYRGGGRTEAIREHEETRGYAAGFEGLIGYINGLLPSNEVLGPALRKTVPMFPEIAVRELVANALIHQDFFVTGSGPMVEIFPDRIEITNPGEPLVDTQRFVDTPPKSRNDALASMMRRFRICEERGTGIDKVIAEIELHQLPAPLFEVPPGFIRTVLFAHKQLNLMDREDKVRACYLHACLKYVTRGFLTNTSLRERFSIEEKNSATASRIIKDTMKAKLIAPHDLEASRRLMKYVPWWAKGKTQDKIEATDILPI